jgi:hypothetical protein
MNHVYDLLAPFLGVANAVALFLVIVFLLLSPLRRRFWIILAYVGWELLATATLTILDVLYHGSAKMTGATQTAGNKLYARYYYSNEVLVDLFRFVLVIVLIYKASEGGRRVSGRMLTGLVLVMMVLPFVLFHPTFTPFPKGVWFNSTSELLNFGAAIMNLMLWATLIASKKREPKLLMVSAGLGVIVTGTAIAYGVQLLLGGGFGAMSFFMNLTQLGGWVIWCWAFRPAPRPHAIPDNVVASPER